MKKALWLLCATLPLLLVACGGDKEEEKPLQVDTLVLPGNAKLKTRSVSYKCEDGRNLKVQYLNKGENSLVLIPVSDTTTLVFSSVISASGSKYMAGQYVWWTKGEDATLYTDWKGGDPSAGIDCKMH